MIVLLLLRMFHWRRRAQQTLKLVDLIHPRIEQARSMIMTVLSPNMDISIERPSPKSVTFISNHHHRAQNRSIYTPNHLPLQHGRTCRKKVSLLISKKNLAFQNYNTSVYVKKSVLSTINDTSMSKLFSKRKHDEDDRFSMKSLVRHVIIKWPMMISPGTNTSRRMAISSNSTRLNRHERVVQ